MESNDGKPGLGTSLIQALAKQLNAEVDTLGKSAGTSISVTHGVLKEEVGEHGNVNHSGRNPAGSISMSIRTRPPQGHFQ